MIIPATCGAPVVAGSTMPDQRLTQDDHRHAEVHRISQVPVEAADDQVPWWIDRGERALTAPGKFKDARGKQRDTQADAHEAEQLRRTGQIELRPAQSEESPRHIASENAWKQNRPEETSQREPSQ